MALTPEIVKSISVWQWEEPGEKEPTLIWTENFGDISIVFPWISLKIHLSSRLLIVTYLLNLIKYIILTLA